MTQDPVQFLLAATGTLLIVLLALSAGPLFALPSAGAMTAGVLALGAGVGAVQRQRARERERTLAEVRGMLRERLSGPLHTLLRAAVPPGDPPGAEERARISEIVNAVRSVESTLELISADAVRAWRVAATLPDE